jgi:hypothetical protein
MKNHKLENKFNFDDINVVNKLNFQTMLHKFKEITQDKELKYIFFNLELSNLLKDELDLFGSSDIQKSYQAYIEKISKLYDATNNEIIFTEFLFCLSTEDTFKFITFLIPTMKIHKFKQDSMVRLQMESLKFLNLMNMYFFEKFSSVNTLSYMNLSERAEAKDSFMKILFEGKPTKKENFKSYSYFPKLVISPKRRTKEKLMEVFEYSYRLIKDDLGSECDIGVMRHTLPAIEDTFILEKLGIFKWRNVIAPYEKDCVRIDVRSCTIHLKGKCEVSVLENYKEAVLLLCDFLNKDYESEMNIDRLVLDKVIISKLLCYIERLTSGQIYLVLENNTIKKPFPFAFTDMIELINELKDLIQWGLADSVLVERVYKHKAEDIFDLSGLFPPQLLKYMKFEYNCDLIVNVGAIKEVKDIRFSYDELFANKSNEKRILFNNYKQTLEKTINVLLTTLNNHIKHNLNKSVYKVLVDPELYDDLDKILKTRCKDELEDLTDSLSLLCLEPVIDRDKTNGHTYTRYYIEVTVTAGYIDGTVINSLVLFNSTRDKLVNILTKAKKEFLFDEEFGVALFFECLFDSGSKGLLIGMNLQYKLFILLKELFCRNPSYQDYIDFIFKTIKLDFIDLNAVNIDKPVAEDLLRSSYTYITHRMFDYLIKNQTNLDAHRRSLGLKFNQDYYLLNQDYSIMKIGKKKKSSMLINKDNWTMNSKSVYNIIKECDYMVINFLL